MSKVAASWRADGISIKRICLDTKNRQIDMAAPVWDIGLLLTLVSEYGLVDMLTEMARLSNEFGTIWNEEYMKVSESRPGITCPIQPVRQMTGDLSDVVNRVFQLVFNDIKTCLCIEKFVPKKSVVFLLEGVKGKAAMITWKVVKNDVVLVPVGEGKWAVVGSEWKKIMTGNLDRLVVV